MKHRKKVKVPATEKNVVDKITCDLCGVEIKRKRFEVDEVEVKHRTGHRYPEGGSGEETSIDLCGKCFHERLIPWLHLQGAVSHTEEWDY